MGSLFSMDGRIYRFCNIVGKVIVASILWIIGCIPVVTIGASAAALYYTTVKAIRSDTGYVHKEFWRAYKRNLKYGSLSTIMLVLLGYASYGWFQILTGNGQANSVWKLLSAILLAAGAIIFLYLYPVMSRFSFSFVKMLQISLQIGLQRLYLTIALAAGFALVLFLQIMVLPIPFIMITPGIWCYFSSFLTEIGIKPYMKRPLSDEDRQWYDDLYEPGKKQKDKNTTNFSKENGEK